MRRVHIVRRRQDTKLHPRALTHMTGAHGRSDKGVLQEFLLFFGFCLNMFC
jgi:hypothetical protein